jgi:hypothetical protein
MNTKATTRNRTISRCRTAAWPMLALIGVGAAQAQQPLGAFPMCEGSAATVIDCPDGSGRCLLVGDNEVRRALYAFRIGGADIDADGQQELRLNLDDDTELSDIEAMTVTADGRLLVFGSFSRKSDCDRSKKRQRFGIISDLRGSRPIDVDMKIDRKDDNKPKKKISCQRIFNKAVLETDLGEAICERIAETEDQAKDVYAVLKDKEKRGEAVTEEDEKKAKARCNEVLPYNAEGAVAIERNGSTEVWIGLRSPLLPAHPSDPERKQLAIVLHLKDLGGYVFDRAAVLDLDGRGVRELAVADGSVWVIAGPPEDLPDGDTETRFQLRRFPVDALADGGAPIDTELVNPSLPVSSEGLAIVDGRAIVVIDGDQGKDPKAPACPTPSRYQVVDLP